ncbi:ATP-grasp domain-containing protein [Bacillus sp. JJ1532]|uniref:ATP-grasp domain-containing protein n=1 Tax=unclassified Bacillus (in: firmicutes) TaxID=185979 RepID=UPI002FFFF12B
MKQTVNLLLTSTGKRTKLLEYFKKELRGEGNLIAVDCSALAPSLYIADEHYIVPTIDSAGYMDVIKEICKKEEISAVISLIDPELSLLSKYSGDLKRLGISSIVSPFDVCELWLDKYEVSKFCSNNGFKYAKTYNSFEVFQAALEREEVFFPVFIKPQKGSASFNIHLARNIEEAKFIFQYSSEMIIQEFLDGQELGVDVYVDLISKKVVSIFIKEKLVMRAGETDKAKSIKSEELFNLIEELVMKAGFIGPIDIDVFFINGEYYISEINPRFGGGYLLAYECGVNFPKFIINNLKGIVNKVQIGNYEENVYMMRHDILTIKKFIEN